jgi:hypothetical protein
MVVLWFQVLVIQQVQYSDYLVVAGGGGGNPNQSGGGGGAGGYRRNFPSPPYTASPLNPQG